MVRVPPTAVGQLRRIGALVAASVFLLGGLAVGAASAAPASARPPAKTVDPQVNVQFFVGDQDVLYEGSASNNGPIDCGQTWSASVVWDREPGPDFEMVHLYWSGPTVDLCPISVFFGPAFGQFNGHTVPASCIAPNGSQTKGSASGSKVWGPCGATDVEVYFQVNWDYIICGC
jgi:hypothetical protein